VAQIANERLRDAPSELARGAFKQISIDASSMISDLVKPPK
jgi:hypothetical protein